MLGSIVVDRRPSFPITITLGEPTLIMEPYGPFRMWHQCFSSQRYAHFNCTQLGLHLSTLF